MLSRGQASKIKMSHSVCIVAPSCRQSQQLSEMTKTRGRLMTVKHFNCSDAAEQPEQRERGYYTGMKTCTKAKANGQPAMSTAADELFLHDEIHRQPNTMQPLSYTYSTDSMLWYLGFLSTLSNIQGRKDVM